MSVPAPAGGFGRCSLPMGGWHRGSHIGAGGQQCHPRPDLEAPGLRTISAWNLGGKMRIWGRKAPPASVLQFLLEEEEQRGSPCTWAATRSSRTHFPIILNCASAAGNETQRENPFVAHPPSTESTACGQQRCAERRSEGTALGPGQSRGAVTASPSPIVRVPPSPQTDTGRLWGSAALPRSAGTMSRC